MRKKLFFVFVLLFFSTSIFCKERIIKEKCPYPTVVEEEPNVLHKIITCNGMLVLKAEVQCENGKTFPFIFMLDTGSASSSIMMEEFSPIQEYFNTKIGGTQFLVCDVIFESFMVENLYLSRFNNISVNLKELKLIFNDKDYYFGILGNDVLMNKSLLLSISKGYFKWNNENPLKQSPSVICPEMDTICSTRSGTDFYQYTIYIEDEYFKSDNHDAPILGFFNSPDKSKSRYFVDTGTYYLATSNLDMYYQIKNRKLSNFTYNSEISMELGYASILKPEFLGKKFDSLQAMSGRTPEMFKCFGNQVLAAFDIYFDKENTEKVQKIYFSPVENSIYQTYREKNDHSYYQASTFGFRVTHSNNRVTEKAFVNGKEILKPVEIGDTILSINGISYKSIKEWELPDKVKIEVKKKKGNIIVINAKRIYLKELAL